MVGDLANQGTGSRLSSTSDWQGLYLQPECALSSPTITPVKAHQQALRNLLLLGVSALHTEARLILLPVPMGFRTLGVTGLTLDGLVCLLHLRNIHRWLQPALKMLLPHSISLRACPQAMPGPLPTRPTYLPEKYSLTAKGEARHQQLSLMARYRQYLY